MSLLTMMMIGSDAPLVKNDIIHLHQRKLKAKHETEEFNMSNTIQQSQASSTIPYKSKNILDMTDSIKRKQTNKKTYPDSNSHIQSGHIFHSSTNPQYNEVYQMKEFPERSAPMRMDTAVFTKDRLESGNYYIPMISNPYQESFQGLPANNYTTNTTRRQCNNPTSVTP